LLDAEVGSTAVGGDETIARFVLVLADSKGLNEGIL